MKKTWQPFEIVFEAKAVKPADIIDNQYVIYLTKSSFFKVHIMKNQTFKIRHIWLWYLNYRDQQKLEFLASSIKFQHFLLLQIYINCIINIQQQKNFQKSVS